MQYARNTDVLRCLEIYLRIWQNEKVNCTWNKNKTTYSTAYRNIQDKTLHVSKPVHFNRGNSMMENDYVWIWLIWGPFIFLKFGHMDWLFGGLKGFQSDSSIIGLPLIWWAMVSYCQIEPNKLLLALMKGFCRKLKENSNKV